LAAPVTVGKQPIVADAVEAFGEDMHEETADELMGLERHRLPAIGSIEPIVLPAKRHAALPSLRACDAIEAYEDKRWPLGKVPGAFDLPTLLIGKDCPWSRSLAKASSTGSLGTTFVDR